jgi:excinuclease ABC subunit B
MAEDLTDYLLESGVKARYLHSEIDTLERIQIIRELRLGEYDVLVGVNLLREGLDLPEVSLWRSSTPTRRGSSRGKTALIQTIGRAARNVNGKVIMYADKLTEAIQGALDETNRRARKQLAYNEEHGIAPEVDRQGRLGHRGVPRARVSRTVPTGGGAAREESRGMSAGELEKLVIELEEEMFAAAEELRFEYAAKLRDEIKELRRELAAAETTAAAGTAADPLSARSPHREAEPQSQRPGRRRDEIVPVRCFRARSAGDARCRPRGPSAP